MKATPSATNVREDKVIGPTKTHMCACVSQSEMMTADRGKKKNR